MKVIQTEMAFRIMLLPQLADCLYNEQQQVAAFSFEKLSSN